MKLILTREECYCSLPDLYDNILRKQGREPAEDDVYEPSRVSCSMNVQEAVKQYIEDNVPEAKDDPDTARFAFVFNWVNSGPHAVERLNDPDPNKYVIEVQPLWCHKKEAE